MIEDKLLIWKFKRGNTEALCRIYEKYKSNLLRLAISLLNDTAAAEDVVHDSFISFAQSSQRLKTGGNLKSYLVVSVANLARNWNRAKRLHETTGLNKLNPVETGYKRPEQWIIYNEQLKQLNNALAQLSYQQREVIILHLQGGMKFRAIAEVQGVSINTVQSRYRYGLGKLRSILSATGGFKQ
jgi:RNA polymerase sigma factor (sigma-70 family)